MLRCGLYWAGGPFGQQLQAALAGKASEAAAAARLLTHLLSANVAAKASATSLRSRDGDMALLTVRYYQVSLRPCHRMGSTEWLHCGVCTVFAARGRSIASVICDIRELVSHLAPWLL